MLGSAAESLSHAKDYVTGTMKSAGEAIVGTGKAGFEKIQNVGESIKETIIGPSKTETQYQPTLETRVKTPSELEVYKTERTEPSFVETKQPTERKITETKVVEEYPKPSRT